VPFDVVYDLFEAVLGKAIKSQQLGGRLPLKVEGVGVLGLFPLGHEADFVFVFIGC
jgi:hypothetical protein